jgi:hypothetical protein
VGCSHRSRPVFDCSPDRSPAAFGVGPESDGPDGSNYACRNKRSPKGCEEEYMEMCVLGGSQIVSRLPPASVSDAAARTALLDCAQCFIMFLG